MQNITLDGAESSGYSSETDSSPDDGELSFARYRTAELSSALGKRLDFARAVAELTGVLQLSNYSTLSQELQNLLLTDIGVAIEACSSDLQDRNLAKALVAAAQRALPKAKASRIARTWKARAVSLTREGKKRATPVEDDASQPVRLPLEVLDHVLAQLHPVSLARAACVCREWREAASAGRLWQRFLGGGGASEAPEPLQATARELFAAAASGREERALRWCARRVLLGGLLKWHDPEWSRPLPLSRPALRVQYPSVSEAVRVTCGLCAPCGSSDDEEDEAGANQLGLGWMHISPAAPRPAPS